MASTHLLEPHAEVRGGLVAQKTVTVARPIGEVYAFWKDFERFPEFMKNIESVETLSPERTHWTVRGPGRSTLEWEADLVEDLRDAAVHWRSAGGEVEHEGYVQFAEAPAGRGTEVRVKISYRPPAGKLGAAASKVMGRDPDTQLREDLYRFKQLLETGEIATNGREEEGAR